MFRAGLGDLILDRIVNPGIAPILPYWVVHSKGHQAETFRYQRADRYGHRQAETCRYRIGTLASSAKPELAGTASCPMHTIHGSTRALGRSCRALNVTPARAGVARQWEVRKWTVTACNSHAALAVTFHNRATIAATEQPLAAIAPTKNYRESSLQ